MSEENQITPDQTEEGPSEAELLAALKVKADTLGVKYSNNIKAETLRERINEALAEPEETEEKTPADPVEETPVELTPAQVKAQTRNKQRKEQMKLIRLRITNMNPEKADLRGEIFTVRTKYLGIVKKFIPFGEATENGYHVPNILYQELKNKKFLHKSAKTDPKTGQIRVTTRFVPEFSLEELPPLDEKDLQKLAAQQAAAAGLED